MRASHLIAAAVLASQASCNSYDLYRVAGYQQQTFTNRADVLFVIDNSDSMVEEAESLAVNFADFISQLEGVSDDRTFNGLSDAVTNYLEESNVISRSVDFQFAITTTDVEATAGQLVGPLVRRTDDNIVPRFLEGLTCGATCFTPDYPLASQSGYRCGDPLGNFLSTQYLDCLCGANQWLNRNCGSEVEEGLEAVFLTMCRAVENPPRACFEDLVDEEGDLIEPALLREADRLSNEGVLRDNANLIVVVVSDEGDGSRRQRDREEIPQEYVDLFDQFGRPMTWVFIGPRLNDAQTDLACPGTGSDFGVIRYNYMSFTTGGRVVDIKDENCDDRPFSQALSELGELLQNLLTSFALQSVPVQETITVLVDGRVVERAENLGVGAFGLDEFSDGWSYRSADNSIQFWGNAIPPYEAEVEVYYRPIDGIPRELPF